ncbi:MAG: malto-oligosyltrehalose synthase [Betaproteobacteria bacterium]|nr:malto-oligosyltrehalose synthase [Betaproteobacteria bacterium]
MSEFRATLERLCALVRLSPTYHDIWGTLNHVPDASLIALLAELGVDATDPARAVEAERALREARGGERLPPVVIVAADSADWSVPLQAQAAGALRWTLELETGERHAGTLAPEAAAFAPNIALPAGYHRLSIVDDGGREAAAMVLAAPARCWRPPALDNSTRLWGPAVQLYGLRSARNWGIGDFGDLLRLVQLSAEHGAGIVGVNPLHALFPHDPAHISPYSPSSRVMLNVLYLDVEAIADYGEADEVQLLVRSPEFQGRLARLREAETVDYVGVASAKFEVLERLYAHFRSRHLGAARPTQRSQAFRDFQSARGEALRRHATFEALQEHFHAADASIWGWPVWPEPYRDHDSDAVASFCAEHLDRVEYFEYLQWLVSIQLERVDARCEALGMEVGLYLDLAVSVDRAGSDAWTYRECYALGASVGAPPDDFNLSGQDWGLPPFLPEALRRLRYAPFINALRNTMHLGGALRIDHVMGLMRLYWIPHGCKATEGAYVHYALDEMLAIVAIESHRNHCLVIGEDLGTVADELRAGLAHYGVLSYRVLFFERDAAGEFLPAEALPKDALVSVSTHDLPTMAGWWEGRDVRLRQELNLFPSDAIRDSEAVRRAQDRVRLLLALERAKLLPEGVSADALPPALDAPMIEAVHAYAAAAPSHLMMLQLEDALGLVEQANLPSTTDEHPNWRRKLPLELDALFESARVRALLERLSKARPHPLRKRVPSGAQARVPRATYRLQLHPGFTFDDAARVVPYLARLGISHLYCSPILRARSGSMHGYDIVDHRSINPELGGQEGFARLREVLRAHDMGILLDIVPNHMGVLDDDNAWWMDVLENGPASAYAHYFDIDWDPVNEELHGKVLVPVLGDYYGNVLARGELSLGFEAETGAFAVRYYEHRFPIDPREYPAILQRAEATMPADLESTARLEFSSLVSAFGHLPRRDAEDPAAHGERARDKELHKQRLAQLARSYPGLSSAIEQALSGFNGEDRQALHALLEAQAYRLAFWRVASDEINYRRFFDINDLAALRMEDDEVFDATHGFVLSMAAESQIDGLRIDHPDGLFDPARYFRRLQQRYARLAGVDPGLPQRGRPPRPLYVAIEKITARHEHVPAAWAVHGTTGYRFGAVLNGVFVDSAARGRIDRIWRAFTGADFDFEEACYRGKHLTMRSALASELTVLATELLRIAREDVRTRDYTFNTLRRALAEVAACMPVYRTYIVRRPSAQDRRYIDWAVARATQRSRATDTAIFGFVRQALLGAAPEGSPPALGERVRRFAMKFQQFTSPVTAKGEEDTAYYVFNRLVSLNEVGADPGVFGVTVRAFHGASADRALNWPHTMLATSTHDNKRSEDVRLRINVISEMPGAWRLLLRRWSTLNQPRRHKLDAGLAPSRNDEYLLYQTLLGTYPGQGLTGEALQSYSDRIDTYMRKAAREAKSQTSWINPNTAYEDALSAFVQTLLSREHANPFLDDLQQQAALVEWFGSLNTLSMALVKYTSPGVPDLYQGNELVDLSLVDPDNRRPVDYAPRARLLDDLRALDPADLARVAQALAAAPQDGRAKLLVTWRLLELRRRRLELLREGDYSGLSASGTRAAHVLAFARCHGRHVLVTIAGRLFAQLLREPGQLPLGEAVWGDTEVEVPELAADATLINAITGERVALRDGRIRLAEAFASFPAATLLGEREA